MFNQLSDNLESTFKKLRGKGKITEKNISDALREVRMSLLEADVEFSVAREFIQKVKEKALGEKVIKSVSPGQQIVKIFQDELTDILGGDNEPLQLGAPQRILMVGLNGAGKTTTSAKLALHLKKQGKKVLLLACDLYRPAAADQLEVLAKEVGVPMWRAEDDSGAILDEVPNMLNWIKEQGGGIAIFDTAGRQEIDTDLVGELSFLKDELEPQETLLVADSATGQQAVSVASHFDDAVGITGLVLTKLDGDARGGAALSMRKTTGVPIKFSGVGEKLADLTEFHPERLAGRILGMGDVVGLVEKAAEEIDEAEAMKMAEKMKKATFDFDDFLSQMRMIKKLGPLEGIMGMLPGMNKLKGLNMDTGKLGKIEAMILSMTPLERTKPEILNGKRRKRIALGSGTSIVEVNQLIKQFAMMRKMMKNKGKMKALMDQMGGMDKGNFPGGMPKF